MKIVYTSLVAVVVLSFPAIAQKLPSVQETSRMVPVDLKIDGKPMEWNTTFEAYNKSTSVFYTIANNKEQLILVFQATVPRVIQKILAGGITAARK